MVDASGVRPHPCSPIRQISAEQGWALTRADQPEHVKSGGGSLLLVRHGHTVWTANDIFTGWIDVPLSDEGRDRARSCAEEIRRSYPRPDIMFTSELERAVQTAKLISYHLGPPEPKLARSWHLNERHYGAAQGRSRADVRAELGDEAYARMHRSWHGVAPVGPSHPADYPELDALRRGLASESLFDVFVRVSAFVRSRLASELHGGRNVLVVSHSNALRALVCLLEAIPPGCADTVEVPMTVPRAYPAAEVLTALSSAESARLIQPQPQEVNS